MVAKAVSFLMFDSFGTALPPVQLGVETKSGCVAAVHATRFRLIYATLKALLKQMQLAPG